MSLNRQRSTAVVGGCYCTKALLTCSVPNLQFAHFSIDLGHFEAKINSDGWKVVIDKLVVAESDEERGLSDALVAYDDDLEEEVLFFDHMGYIRV